MNVCFWPIADAVSRQSTGQVVWQEIFDSWSGLSESDQASLVRNLVCSTFRYNKDLFQTMFRPVIRQLEQRLTMSNGYFTNDDEVAILILETQAGGVGEYGGTLILDPEAAGTGYYPTVDGLLDLQSIVSAAGGDLAGISQALTYARNRERALANGEPVTTVNADGTETVSQTLTA